MNDGWIKLHRKMLSWGWYSDSNTKALFLHLLFHATYEPTEYMGYKLNMGDCVFGRKKWADELGMTERSIRTALNHLKSTSEVTIKTTSKFSVVTIVNYSKYQCFDLQTDQHTDHQSDQRPTSNRPAIDHIKEGNKVINKESINNICTDVPTAEQQKRFVKPSVEDIKAYCAEINAKIDADTFYDYYESNGWCISGRKMKDWKATVRNWDRREKKGQGGYKPKPDKPAKGTSYDLDDYERSLIEETPKLRNDRKVT